MLTTEVFITTIVVNLIITMIEAITVATTKEMEVLGTTTFREYEEEEVPIEEDIEVLDIDISSIKSYTLEDTVNDLSSHI